MKQNLSINDFCTKCGRPLRNGRCDYGCDSYGNYKRYNNRIAKVKLKPQHKCYYCNETENLEIDTLPITYKRVHLCPFHMSWNWYSRMNKEYPDKFRSLCMPGLVALVKKMKEKKRMVK